MEKDNFDTINFRLGKIEQTLSDLKNVLVDNKLQARDIKELNNKHREILDAINAHDKRIRKLEEKPTQEKAEKWKFISDYIFKAVVIAIATIFLSKIGL